MITWKRLTPDPRLLTAGPIKVYNEDRLVHRYNVLKCVKMCYNVLKCVEMCLSCPHLDAVAGGVDKLVDCQQTGVPVADPGDLRKH